MHKTAVIYWSRTGNTEAMAKAIERGLRAGGSQTTLLRVSETGASVAERYDRFALGCPAMGKEVLEERRFDPFFTAIEKNLRGKRVALFGTYGWGNGKWMRDWQTRVIATGARLFEQGLIFQVENPLVTRIKRIFGREKKPDEAACFAFGKRFAADETEKGEL
ncbi:MAG: flavodoxin domain-containing protein [Treponema sp.]|jgi:flavodoxin short chain|nr:flavodoxin domain-containing protein [Treponema sp.]